MNLESQSEQPERLRSLPVLTFFFFFSWLFAAFTRTKFVRKGRAKKYNHPSSQSRSPSTLMFENTVTMKQFRRSFKSSLLWRVLNSAYIVWKHAHFVSKQRNGVCICLEFHRIPNQYGLFFQLSPRAQGLNSPQLNEDKHSSQTHTHTQARVRRRVLCTRSAGNQWTIRGLCAAMNSATQH